MKFETVQELLTINVGQDNHLDIYFWNGAERVAALSLEVNDEGAPVIQVFQTEADPPAEIVNFDITKRYVIDKKDFYDIFEPND